MAASRTPPANPPTNTSLRWLLGAVAVGALVSVGLGAYGRVHQPTFESTVTFGFPSQIEMKVGLAAVVGVLGIVQLVTSLRMYGRLGRGRPSPAVAITHRGSGVAAVLVSLPVAFHCLWSLGFQDYSNRVLLHSVMGCLFYGAFVTKMLALRIKGLPGWAIPALGGITFAILVCVIATSALWWLSSGRPTY